MTITLDSIQIPSLVMENYVGATIVCCALLVTLLYRIYNQDALYPGFKVIGFEKNALSYSKAKALFIQEARNILWTGFKTGKPFQVISAIGPTIVFPSSYVNELKSDSRLNMKGFVKREFFPTYPGFEGIAAGLDNTIAEEAIKKRLTQSLNLITKDLCEETEFSVTKIFGEPHDWTSFTPMNTTPNLVARLSTRVFLGPVVARDEQWLQIAVSYTIDLMRAMRALRLWPVPSRPFVHWFLPECKNLRIQYRNARKIIEEEIARRKVIWEENNEAGKKVSKTSDSLGWMQEIAHGRPFDLAGAQLGLTFAAIHTTSDLITKSMIRLSRNPKLADEIRYEMVSTLSQEGMKKTSLYKMKLLDSFLKEVQRVDPLSITSMNRIAAESIELSDGTHIPKGAYLKVFKDSMFNENVFPDPDKFDPYRYFKLRSQLGQEHNWQFVTTGKESLGFGHGTHACPGRFFASNEVKIALCWLLLKYEWKLEDGAEEPQNMYIATEVIADPRAKLLYRRRKEELDMVALFAT